MVSHGLGFSTFGLAGGATWEELPGVELPGAGVSPASSPTRPGAVLIRFTVGSSGVKPAGSEVGDGDAGLNGPASSPSDSPPL